ncbi:hypothetical protein ACIHCX_27315 [Streptomyces sp. NPDC052043]|uniref:hypothetical protein n=1 Tax=Streptomyces sp. NPDC052043 TaxID=3365684 RepID=UPI0037CD76EB
MLGEFPHGLGCERRVGREGAGGFGGLLGWFDAAGAQVIVDGVAGDVGGTGEFGDGAGARPPSGGHEIGAVGGEAVAAGGPAAQGRQGGAAHVRRIDVDLPQGRLMRSQTICADLLPSQRKLMLDGLSQ